MSKKEILEMKIQLLEEVMTDLSKMFFPDGEDYADLETDWENGQLKVTINFDQKQFEEELKADIESIIDCKIETIKNEINQNDGIK
jgi:hypothetical protein